MWLASLWGHQMKHYNDMEAAPLKRHAAHALRRARQLPVGHARNDLRQLAVGLLWLERKGLQATIQSRLAADRNFYHLFRDNLT
jgi:hypothetical protein